MNNNKFSIKDAKQLDLVQYLEKLGYQLRTIRNNSYWYLSPLRDEKTPSFKVNKTINCWYDFGLGAGGSIIDFGIRYFNCSVKDFLEKLSDSNYNIQQRPFSFKQHEVQAENTSICKIRIIDAYPIKSSSLISYINSRCIDLELATKYCEEVSFELYNKRHTAIGFKNDKGGYELRNTYFKGSSSPKFTTLICPGNRNKDLVVFEGFFDFLAHQTTLQANQQLPESQASYLVLNSLSYFELSKSLMEQHESVRLFLDRDKAGIEQTQKALQLKTRCIDCSNVYKGFKDYNDLLMNRPLKQEHAKRIGRHI